MFINVFYINANGRAKSLKITEINTNDKVIFPNEGNQREVTEQKQDRVRSLDLRGTKILLKTIL